MAGYTQGASLRVMSMWEGKAVMKTFLSCSLVFLQFSVQLFSSFTELLQAKPHSKGGTEYRDKKSSGSAHLHFFLCYTGSLLLCTGLLQLQCEASHCGGCSCCGAQALACWLSSSNTQA